MNFNSFMLTLLYRNITSANSSCKRHSKISFNRSISFKLEMLCFSLVKFTSIRTNFKKQKSTLNLHFKLTGLNHQMIIKLPADFNAWLTYKKFTFLTESQWSKNFLNCLKKRSSKHKNSIQVITKKVRIISWL